MKTSVGALLTTAVTTILIGCGNDASDPDLVARAGEYRLTVDDVVELLEDEESLPAQAAVVESLVDLWIDYTLLADAAVEDTLFSDLDLIPLVRQQVDREMVFQLRDSVIQVDTFITPEELRNLYTSQAPEVEIRARHIMLTLPFEATGEQRDSVRLVLEGLRERIITGARFEDVARAFSQDPGSSQSGGDLGFFMRGDMVLPFEEAALALEPGELSEVVETPMGLHLIRVEERRVQDFEEAAPAFRARVQAERTTAAESTFVAGLEGRSPPRTTEGAYEVVRELARNPGTRVTGRAARRALVEWDGGAYEVRDLQDLLQFEQPLMRQQVAASTDEDLETFLLGLARRTLLIAEARRSGLEPPRARLDSLTEGVRSQLLGVARSLGLTDLDQAPGEEREIAIARAVRQALADNLAGA
ncbi:MAG TPA: peptidylprolyl isomerase, partial [Longimicrobiales bacterium]|nr:peptidylprolyl isomerase [Longimicrobiales bacterium]